MLQSQPAVAKLLKQCLVLMAAAVRSLRSYTPRGTCPSLHSFHYIILYVLNTLEYHLSTYAFSWLVVIELQTFQPNSSHAFYHFNSFYMPVHLILLHSTIPTKQLSPPPPPPPHSLALSSTIHLSAMRSQAYLTMPSTANIILRRWWISE